MNPTHTSPSAPSQHANAWQSARRFLATVGDLFEQFIWGDLRDGMLDLSPLPRSLRLLVYFGMTLALLLILLITQSGWVRATFDLQPSLVLVPGRGLLIPIILYPLGLFLFGLAWTFALTGAVFSAWPIRVGLLILYLLSVAGWISSLPVSAPGYAVLGSTLVLITSITVIFGRRLRRHPLRLFALLLLTTGGLFAAIHAPTVAQDRASGLSIGSANLENNLRALAVLAMPLLILVGLDIADFAQHAAEWVTQAATSLVPRYLLLGVTWAALLWLLYAAITGWLDAPSVNQTWPSMLGVLILVLLLVGSWLTLAHIHHRTVPLRAGELMAACGRLAAPLILVYFFPPLLAYMALGVALVFQNIAIELDGMVQMGLDSAAVEIFVQVAQLLYLASLAFSTVVNLFINVWLRWIMVGVLLLTPYLLKRGRVGIAFMMVTVSIHLLWLDLTRPGAMLGALTWDDTNFMALIWAVVLVGTLAGRAWRRREFVQATPRLLLIVVILAMLRDTSFIEDPFSPFFAFAGLGFLAFGLGWDLLTSGRWANLSTPRLPQAARIFMYLGYLLITVTLVNWAVHSHDIEQLNRFTGEAALFGFFLLGRPYLFLLLFGLATDIIQLEPSASDAEPEMPVDVHVT